MKSPFSHSSGGKAKAALVFLSLLPLYYLSYTLRISPLTQSTASYSPKDFAEQWLNASLLGPLDLDPIRAHCAATTWRPNLVFNLDESNGGIGNVRAHFLDFTLFAIEAGAAMILPGMTIRSDSDLFDVWHGTHANFSRMFDQEHFIARMAEACPEMRIYLPGEKDEVMTKVETPYDARSRRMDFDAGNTREAAYGYTTSWLREHHVESTTLSQVDVHHTMWEVDTRSLGSDLRRYFGQMFPFRPDVRGYTAVAMAALASKHGIPIDPSQRLHRHAFYGAHLRTEQDTVSAGWFNPNTPTEVGLNFDEQTDAYLAHAAEHSLRVMYVATGNASELARFAAKAAESDPPVTITSKWDLLPSPEAEALAELDWDQQALVDMEILMRCSVFGGFAKSSFAFAIAVARNAYLEAHGLPLGYNWRMREVNDQVAFDDGLSRILGRNEMNERKCPRGCWP